jgi:hypothetical protein
MSRLRAKQYADAITKANRAYSLSAWAWLAPQFITPFGATFEDAREKTLDLAEGKPFFADRKRRQPYLEQVSHSDRSFITAKRLSFLSLGSLQSFKASYRIETWRIAVGEFHLRSRCGQTTYITLNGAE